MHTGQLRPVHLHPRYFSRIRRTTSSCGIAWPAAICASATCRSRMNSSSSIILTQRRTERVEMHDLVPVAQFENAFELVFDHSDHVAPPWTILRATRTQRHLRLTARHSFRTRECTAQRGSRETVRKVCTIVPTLRSTAETARSFLLVPLGVPPNDMSHLPCAVGPT